MYLQISQFSDIMNYEPIQGRRNDPMKKLVADIHMHTLVSGHAYGTIREMASAAKTKDLKLIGISEHGPGIPGTVNEFYYTNLEMIPRFINDIEVIHGCEINVLNNGKLSLEQKYIEFLDYAIAGIHSPCYNNEGIQKNTWNIIECMKNDKVCFISHPDDDHTPLDYEQLVKAAKQYHVALEINNSSLVKKQYRLNCYQNYEIMIKLCHKYHVPMIISSDAHDPYWVGNFDAVLSFLETMKIDEQLILNNDINKLKQFIGL